MWKATVVVMLALFGLLILPGSAWGAWATLDFVGGPDFDTSDAISASASGIEASGRGPDNVVNGDGLDGAGLLHSGVKTDMWASENDAASSMDSYNAGTTVGEAWIAFEFDQVYDLVGMWVWNYNREYEVPLWQDSMKDVIIEYSTTGGTNPAEWNGFSTTLNPGAGAPGEAHETEIALGVSARYVVITSDGPSWGESDGEGRYGLSEVRFFVPEPMTLAVLALGSLAALIRRRR